MATCYVPDAYKCVTAREIEDVLTAAIVEHIDRRRLTSADISKRYPSIRLEHIAKLRRGEPLGFRMLSAISEAIGLKVNVQVAA
jgi:hypothetical protein